MRHTKMNSIDLRSLALAAAGAVVLAGCGGSQGSAAVADTAPPMPAAAPKLDFGSMPGLPMDADPNAPKEFKLLATNLGSRVGHRADPFKLKPAEQKFEIQQDTERLMGTMGGFVVEYEPPVEKEPNAGLVTEPQPYRRLSGVIVGDSVYALMDTGGENPVIIRPGMKVPNTDWTVVSIDAEKAVLRRSGNKLPHQVTVRLESPPPGMGGGAPNTGATNPGAPGGFQGRPSMPGGGKMGGGAAGGGGAGL